MSAKCTEFWHRYIQREGLPADMEPYDVFHYTDQKRFADYLAKATISGAKTGTSCLLWDMQTSESGLVTQGDLSIVTYANGDPACVIKTLSVEIVPFNQVSSTFASTEGEANSTLDYWRQCHWKEFSDICIRLKKEPSQTMPVVCETIDAVFVN